MKRRAPGSCVNTALVVTGAADALMFPGTGPWNIAPADILIREAGGRSTDLEGNLQCFDGPINGALISNELIHDRLLEIVGQYRRNEMSQRLRRYRRAIYCIEKKTTVNQKVERKR